ncbi:MAG: response regulator, partial [Bacteroidota bacterium]
MNNPVISAVIIDDEIKGRETLKSLLEEFCEHVVVMDTFSTIKAGVSGVKALNPDVVFLDISLPVEDGFQFFKYFENPSFEVVFVTAYTAYLDKAASYAALDYLMKPVYIEDLKRIVQELKTR